MSFPVATGKLGQALPSHGSDLRTLFNQSQPKPAVILGDAISLAEVVRQICAHGVAPCETSAKAPHLLISSAARQSSSLIYRVILDHHVTSRRAMTSFASALPELTQKP